MKQHHSHDLFQVVFAYFDQTPGGRGHFRQFAVLTRCPTCLGNKFASLYLFNVFTVVFCKMKTLIVTPASKCNVNGCLETSHQSLITLKTHS